jgi:hypothetical protein
MELTALEESADLLHVEAIGGHVGVLGVPFPRDLVHHQVGVSETEDPPNTNLLGQLEPMHQGLVFRDVVRHAEVHLQHVLQLVSLRRGENDTAPKRPSILEPSKFMHQYVESEADGKYWCSPQSAKKSAMI